MLVVAKSPTWSSFRVCHSELHRERSPGRYWRAQRWSLDLGSAFSGYGTPGFVLYLWGSASPSDASSQGIKKYDLVLCIWPVAQTCLTLCDPVDSSPPGSSVHGISQARILEWVAMPSSRGSSRLPWLLHWQVDSLPLCHLESQVVCTLRPDSTGTITIAPYSTERDSKPCPQASSVLGLVLYCPLTQNSFYIVKVKIRSRDGR